MLIISPYLEEGFRCDDPGDLEKERRLLWDFCGPPLEHSLGEVHCSVMATHVTAYKRHTDKYLDDQEDENVSADLCYWTAFN